MKAKLLESQRIELKQMNTYWEEVSQREDCRVLDYELANITRILSSKQICLIIGDYAKNYEEK